MDEQQTKLTVGVFADKDSAEHAFNEAMKLGYSPEEINVLMSEDSRKKYYDSFLNPKPEETTTSLAVGGALGGAIGTTIGALIALGTNIALPGLGLILAGPLVGAVGVSGVLLGGLIGWGDNQPQVYEELLKKGNIILAVHETKDKPSLEQAWKPFISFN